MKFTPATPTGTAVPGTSVAPNKQASPCANAPTDLSPAERTAKLLAFRNHTYNFTQGRIPSKAVHFSTGRNATI